MKQPDYDLEDRLLKFAAAIIKFTKPMGASYAERHIASQLLRSGTAPLASHGEAEAARSRRDFISKMGICLQELRETQRWLKLLNYSEIAAPETTQPLLAECDELIRIFYASIRTAESGNLDSQEK